MQIDRFTVTLQGLNRLHGGIPSVNLDTPTEDRAARYEPWVGKQSGDPDAAAAIAVELAADETMPETDGDYAINGFRRLDGLPVIEVRQVKALIREAMQRLGYFGNGKDARMKQHLQHDIVVRAANDGDFLCLGVDDIDGIDERPIHVMTPQGPRTSIAMNEYVEGWETTFVVKVLNGGVAANVLDERRVRELFEDYAQNFAALGANRSQGFGRFKVKEIVNG